MPGFLLVANELACQAKAQTIVTFSMRFFLGHVEDNSYANSFFELGWYSR
jgi:hypothetical protein